MTLVQKTLKNQKGLTLIELLAVIVILGIIAAIAVPAIGGIIESSREKAKVSEALNIISAAKIAHASGEGTPDGDDLVWDRTVVGDPAVETSDLSTYVNANNVDWVEVRWIAGSGLYTITVADANDWPFDTVTVDEMDLANFTNPNN